MSIATTDEKIAAAIAKEDRTARPNPDCARPTCDGPRVRVPFSSQFVNCECVAQMRCAGGVDRAKA